jgi:ankyrin repeat protein
MKLYLSLLGLFCFGVDVMCAGVRVINNTNMPARIDYEVPIYNRADTQITPIKSQQELQDLLHEAILTNSTQEIMQVVKAGADVNLFKDGKAPLMWATALKKYNSVEVLKRCGAIMPCPKNMLYRAILDDSAEDVRHAVNAGADPEDINVAGEGLYPLGLAVFLTKSEAVRALLKCDVNSDRMSKFATFKGIQSKLPLEYALSMGDIRTALVLLKHNKHKSIIQMSVCGCDCFQYLAERINPAGIKNLVLEFMQELIDQGYDINSGSERAKIVNNVVEQYKSAWVSVIQSPFYSDDMLELLMKNGANPSQYIYATPHGRWTPLHIAIQSNNLRAVRFLLGVGADVTKKAGPIIMRGRGRAQEQTPLSYAKSLASRMANFETNIIKLLIKYRAPL